MRISFKRSGGVAGNVNYSAPPLEIDLDELPADRAEELRRLVEEARLLDQPPPTAAASAARDELGYELTVEEGGRSRTIRAGGEPADAGLTSLLEWLDDERRSRVGKELAARKKQKGDKG